MANLIQHKRSSVASKIPTTSDLAFGELAINTRDGKLFIKKSDGTTETVVEIGGLSGTVGPANGGTGTTNLSGLVFGNGSNVMTAATATQVVSTIGNVPVAQANVAATAATVTGIVSLNNGGTGATTAAAARAALGVISSASPVFSGVPTAPTADAGTNTTQLATTAFVLAAVATGLPSNFSPDITSIVRTGGRLVSYVENGTTYVIAYNSAGQVASVTKKSDDPIIPPDPTVTSGAVNTFAVNN